MIIRGARVMCDDFILRTLDVEVSGGAIAALGEALTGGDVVNAQGCMLLPGLIDIHTHGAVGHDTCDADASGYAAMCAYYAQRGVTSFLFTTMTLAEKTLTGVLGAIDAFLQEAHPGATPRGVYLEGPFISAAKKAAQNGDYIARPDSSLLERLDAASGGRIRIVAVAPEVPGARAFIEQVRSCYQLSMGHTAADYDTALQAAKGGVAQVTHLYNAMLVPDHRAPGVPYAAFDAGLYTELICDGIHVHPSVARATFRLAREDRMILISDSMQAAGMPDGRYRLGGQEVFVQKGCARLANGALAGSCSSVLDGLRNAVAWGVPLARAVRACTINPANAAGIARQVGSITVGKQADLLLVDDRLNIRQVFIAGKPFPLKEA
nr:N-acetylglucosamine-6-phosphate deacetylase [Maliibacterium massiliense]